MVAETAKIARSDIETVGFHPAVFFVLLKEKRLVDDTASYDVGRETAADDYLVETPPLAMIAVGALAPCVPTAPADTLTSPWEQINSTARLVE